MFREWHIPICPHCGEDYGEYYYLYDTPAEAIADVQICVDDQEENGACQHCYQLPTLPVLTSPVYGVCCDDCGYAYGYDPDDVYGPTQYYTDDDPAYLLNEALKDQELHRVGSRVLCTECMHFDRQCR